ncbi:MAG TPA: nucleoside hydrolase-like domain-containing protein [Flavobacteriaceae bacterium]|nr:nucleoside hydrolase-like domain-containing protein [Flavobacteriaceae bacterium]
MDSVTPGSQHIVNVLLDETDNNPVLVQAWGGTNTIARALKTIEEEHPEKMETVANKLKFFFIWEQDSTYQSYIRPHWGKYNIQTIICDQFWAIAYQWDKVIPSDKIDYFKVDWMKSNILEGHGPLCSLYQAYQGGDDNEGWGEGNPKQKGAFRSEGDSPAFIHTINTGLRNMESPDYGGWGGRYINVRENTWLDPVPISDYKYPEGRWYTKSAWGRNYMRSTYPENQNIMNEYFKPIVRWSDAIQNDFAARADWCVASYKEANHHPVVKLHHGVDIRAKSGDVIQLSAKGTYDPDDDELYYNWWQYEEADTYEGIVEIMNSKNQEVSLKIPEDVQRGETIHIICEVKDNGRPSLTRYQRVIIQVK